MNHSSIEKIAWFQREYPDAIQHIRQHGSDDGGSSCDSCIAGKSKRKPFVNLSGNRYAPLEAVSSDTTGPISQQDLDGNKYLQLIADKGTGYLAGEPMKAKSGASSAIHKALARLQLLCGRKVQRFHTDNADEQNCGPAKDFLDKQGTVRTFTAPNSSPSNTTVERRFETVFGAARTSLKAAPAPLNKPGFWSLAALDVIDKSNYLAFMRDGILQPSPHTSMQMHGCATDIFDGPASFLPFGQSGWIINTAKHKKKLEDRAIPANYLRRLSKDTYQVYRRDKNSITSVRQNEFVLKLEKKSHGKRNNSHGRIKRLTEYSSLNTQYHKKVYRPRPYSFVTSENPA